MSGWYPNYNYAQSNPLLRQYNQAYYNPAMMGNNAYIRSNPMFNPQVQMNMTQQARQANMAQYARQMQELRKLHEIKKMQRYSDISSLYDKDKLRDAIINPEQHTVSDKEREEIMGKFNMMDTNYSDYMEYMMTYWKGRTNTPYKAITDKNVKFRGKMYKQDFKKDIKKTDDLIIHKVTPLEKQRATKIIENDFADFLAKKKEHDDELEVIFALSEKGKHFKKFQYNHKFKYRLKFKPSDHTKMKKSKFKLYEDEMKKLEQGRKNMDLILNGMIQSDIWSKDELSDFGILDGDQIDIDELEKKLEKKLGINE